MPELRKDPIIGRWVIISTERAKRPEAFRKYPNVKKGGFCPFCEGNESHTPSEILAYRPNSSARNGTGWTLRVVSNKYPALMIEGDLGRVGMGIYDHMNGVGAHEVIIESPRHEDTLSQMSTNQINDIFWAFRDRILDLQNDKRFRYILIFKNEGEPAGASLEHTHSQLIALPIIPKRMIEELDGSQSYFNYKERCIFCDIIRQDISDGDRIIDENEEFISLIPFAPRFPFETWILPKRHNSRFESAQKNELESLSKILKRILMKIDKVLEYPPYNLVLHSSPFSIPSDDYYHWHIELMPKLTHVAGFEWGTGFYINPTPPEEAAEFLRSASIT
ncbi:MAG: galactose-1-phosphate uridylyltransferase [Candidatus Fischerbacteria bacterium RBG_13_37_8]|uniref:Galactose-1-phosphate uridylyltransferase n=1 Tax=Candidatus Fischerbacteria bacterium RBG_13_37_8 TaxID=1817863 RepID=A0A1F5VMD2_9BACT|nr:MAG: galactose-1-phosphate uridylyltransferase [Candidatus Fischerbacteria bacterium RBG_13_37_8]